MAKIIKKKKHITKVPNAVLYVNSRPNNTILSLASTNGNVVSQVSCGSAGFKNCKKSSPYALKQAINIMLSKMTDHLVQILSVVVRGINMPVDLFTMLQKSGIQVTSIEYDTCIAYGGTRQPRMRRT